MTAKFFRKVPMPCILSVYLAVFCLYKTNCDNIELKKTEQLFPRFRKGSNSLIVQGLNMLPAPFFVRVFSDTLFGLHRCGGTLIRPSWVLTSASCVQDIEESRISIQTELPSKAQQTVFLDHVTKSVVHPEYKPGTEPRNNIALLKLQNPRSFFDTLPLCSEKYEACPMYGTCGMGTISSHEYLEPENLRQIFLFESKRNGLLLRCPKEFVCTNPVFERANICSGDIGGPLYSLDDKVNPACVYGVASHTRKLPFKPDKCRDGSVFTRVQYFESWILNVLSEN